MGRYYGGAYYGPRVQPDEYYGPENIGADVAGAITQLIAERRTEKREKRAEDEYEYNKSQRPLDEAVRIARALDLGIRPRSKADTGKEETAPSQRPMVPAPADPTTPRMQPGMPGGDRGVAPDFADPGFMGGPRRSNAPEFVDEGFVRRPSNEAPDPGFVRQPGPDVDPGFTRAPDGPAGSFSPAQGGFVRAPYAPRDLGNGYVLDESQTARGRAAAQAADDEERLVAAGIPRGIAAYAARHPEHSQAILTKFFDLQDPENKRWYPGSMDEAVELWQRTQGTRGDEDEGLIMPLDKALQWVDDVYAITDEGVVTGHRLNPAARHRLALQIARGQVLPQDLPPTRTVDAGGQPSDQLRQSVEARFGNDFYTQRDRDAERGARHPAQPPASAPNVEAARSLVREYRDIPEAELRRVLQRRGYTPQQIDQVLADSGRTSGTGMSRRMTTHTSPR